MNGNSTSLPVYAKITIIIIGLIGLFYILYIGQEILIPLVFATIFAILLNPIVNYLHYKRINRFIAILVVLVAGLIAAGAIIYFISVQVASFADAFPLFKTKFVAMSNDFIQWISETFNIRKSKIEEWIQKNKTEGINSTPGWIGQTLLTIGGLFAYFFLLPVYIFMILWYKPLLLNFTGMLFSKNNHGLVAEVLLESKSLIQSYLSGLLVEMVLVAVLNSVGLLIIGLDYAILLGIIAAILNIIPYIGGIIAIAFPILIAVATKTPATALWVIAVYLVVQFIDNNIIVPKIVASKVKINALVSVVVVLAGGALWGVAGMFLSIPVSSILKVIFDRVEPLKPFGFLLGDTIPPIRRMIIKFKKYRP